MLLHGCSIPSRRLSTAYGGLQNVAKFEGHKGAITAVSFSENGCAASLCQPDTAKWLLPA